jgi:hypothetical protein
VDIGESPTTDSLMKELDIKERVGSLIDQCLKRVVLVRRIVLAARTSARLRAPPAQDEGHWDRMR